MYMKIDSKGMHSLTGMGGFESLADEKCENSLRISTEFSLHCGRKNSKILVRMSKNVILRLPDFFHRTDYESV